MIDKILKVLNFIVGILPLISKLSSRVKGLSESLGKMKPIEKEESWRDRL
jgi:hypothetical protein